MNWIIDLSRAPLLRKNDPWSNGISLRLWQWAPPSTSTPAGIGAKVPEREEGERGKGRGRGQEYQIYEEWRDETLVGVPATEGAHFSRISTWQKPLQQAYTARGMIS